MQKAKIKRDPYLSPTEKWLRVRRARVLSLDDIELIQDAGVANWLSEPIGRDMLRKECVDDLIGYLLGWIEKCVEQGRTEMTFGPPHKDDFDAPALESFQSPWFLWIVRHIWTKDHGWDVVRTADQALTFSI
jgi:hypothetical protein